MPNVGVMINIQIWQLDSSALIHKTSFMPWGTLKKGEKKQPKT